MSKQLTRSILLSFAVAMAGCASTATEEKKKDVFFTSGNREADRRGAGATSKEKKDVTQAGADEDKGKLTTDEKVTLYERLGGEDRIRLIVDDFVKRALEDPRVNWSRKGLAKGGMLRRDRSVKWEPTPANIQRLKNHFVQFISLAAGGPIKYDGKPIKPLHENMRITRAEFDATIGDLKATLDNLKVANEVQRDLISIFESTRPQIVPER
jgi:hemoglobin